MHPCEEQHEQLAVHAVHHTSVPREEGVEVLNVVGPLDGTGHEAAEGSHDRGEEAVHEAV